MADDNLRALERTARRTREQADIQAYARALERVEGGRLQQMLGTGSDWWQNLMYRRALKELGTGRADLDISIPHIPHEWRAVGSPGANYGAARVELVQQCIEDPETKLDDCGVHPFFLSEARPLTFRETAIAQLESWRSGKELYFKFLSTCSAVVFEAENQRCRIVPMSQELLNMRAANVTHLAANYARTQGTELMIDGTFARPMTAEQAMVHPGWRAVFEGDLDLLREYAQVACATEGLHGQGMMFHVIEDTLIDELHWLVAAPFTNGGGCVSSSNSDNIVFARMHLLR